MDGLDGDHVVTPTVTSRNNRGAVFSVRGRCHKFITRQTAYLDSGCGEIGERKAIPVTGRGGPQDCETSRLPHFLEGWLAVGCEVVSLTAQPPQEDS
jgi:hypothetical protein